MTAYVYSLTHRATGREYIGMTERSVQKRVREHMSDARTGQRSAHLHQAVRKYGEAAFYARVEAELPTRAEALIAERIAIALRRPVFNMTVGGDGISSAQATEINLRTWAEGKRPRRMSDEARARMSAALMGRAVTEAQRAAMDWTGRRHTPEAKAKMSAGRKGWAQRPGGWKHSAESIAKMSAAHRARRAKQEF